MQKKVLIMLVATLALAYLAAPASAIQFTEGGKLMKLRDHSALYVDPDLAENVTPWNPVPLIGPGGFVPWGEQRTIFRTTTIFDEDDNVEFDTSYPFELTGVLYELELAQIVALSPTNFILDFAPISTGASVGLGASPNSPRNPILGDVDGDRFLVPAPFVTGGVVELYQDAAKNYTANPGGVVDYDDKLPASPPVLFDAGAAPTLWTEGQTGGIRDQFPTVTDGTNVLSAVLIDLNYLVSVGVVTAPAVPFATGAVIRETFEFSTGAGHGFAYGNVVGGTDAAQFARGTIAPFVDLAMLFDLNTPILSAGVDGIFGTADDQLLDTLVYQGPGQWTVDSQDPVVFEIVIPEPGTLALLGLGLVGLVVRRRRK